MKRSTYLPLAIAASALTAAFVLSAAGPSSASGSGRGDGSPPGTHSARVEVQDVVLTDADVAGLLYMREEEKLAHDLYVDFAGKWDLPIFATIAESEQRHEDSVQRLLDRYGIADPTLGNGLGEFTDPDLQLLYDELLANGSATLADALEVGVIVEQTDIADLEAQTVTARDVALVYDHLEAASERHLDAFTTQLDRLGVEA